MEWVNIKEHGWPEKGKMVISFDIGSEEGLKKEFYRLAYVNQYQDKIRLYGRWQNPYYMKHATHYMLLEPPGGK
jgi:hypothetical protein